MRQWLHKHSWIFAYSLSEYSRKWCCDNGTFDISEGQRRLDTVACCLILGTRKLLFIKSLYFKLMILIWSMQQKAIEILLEHRADINMLTNNDENVLELCDDLDIRDFIVQKHKEIELSQQQEALVAEMQKQLANSHNSSFRKTNSIDNTSVLNQMTSSNSNINNSTRSLKRTSTGVSRR